MIKTVIVDDENHARTHLKNLLKNHFLEVEVIGEAFSVKSATEVIDRLQPELVFLDIDLTDGTGFNVLEQIKKKSLNVVFITAFNDFAIKAIRYNALDYILKPIELHELGAAIERIKKKFKEQPPSQADLMTMIANLSKPEEKKKLVIRNLDSITYIDVKDIVRCEADGHYTSFHLMTGDRVVASKALKEYESLLPETTFFRIHKSHLINLNYVWQFSKVDGGTVVMKDKSTIDIARRRKDLFFERLESFHEEG